MENIITVSSDKIEAIATALKKHGFEDYDGDWDDDSLHFTDGFGNEITISSDRKDLILTLNDDIDYEDENATPMLSDDEVYQLVDMAKAGGFEFYIKTPYGSKSEW